MKAIRGRQGAKHMAMKEVKRFVVMGLTGCPADCVAVNIGPVDRQKRMSLKSEIALMVLGPLSGACRRPSDWKDLGDENVAHMEMFLVHCWVIENYDEIVPGKEYDITSMVDSLRKRKEPE